MAQRNLPSHNTYVSPDVAPSENLEVHPTHASAIDWDHPPLNDGVFYGDASGGIFTSYPTIRRIGCGVVQIKPDGSLLWALNFNLPGWVQTVPRGELYVLVFVVQRLRPRSVITYVTDNLDVYRMFNKGEQSALKSSNCDLFKLVFSEIRLHHLDVTVRWMPSHLKPGDPRPVGVSELDIVANDLADEQAKAAAKRVEVPLNTSTPVLYYYALVRKIQKRLIDVLISLPHRSKTSRSKQLSQPIARPSLDSLIETSQHFAFLSGTRVICAVCKCSLPVKGESTRHWLRASCNGAPSDETKPVKLHNTIIQIGHLSTHPSHDLHVIKNVIYCNKCGSHAHTRIKNLARKCQEPGTYGTKQLKMFMNGQIPHNVNNRFHLVHPGTQAISDPMQSPDLVQFRADFNALRARVQQSGASEHSGDSKEEVMEWHAHDPIRGSATPPCESENSGSD